MDLSQLATQFTVWVSEINMDRNAVWQIAGDPVYHSIVLPFPPLCLPRARSQSMHEYDTDSLKHVLAKRSQSSYIEGHEKGQC